MSVRELQEERIKKVRLDDLWRLEKQIDSANQHLRLALKVVRKMIGDTRVYKPSKKEVAVPNV